MFPEVYVQIPSNNDDAFHWLLVQRANEALSNGENILDFWTPQLEMGFASFVHYQHLPHVAVVILDRLTFGIVPLLTMFNFVRYLLLALLPVTVLWSMRRIGLSWPAATFGACAASLLSSPFLYGFDYGSYVWRGFGTYTQLWGMHLSFIAVAATHTVLTQRRGHLLAIITLSLLVLSHLLYAYIVALSVGVMFLTNVRRDSAVVQMRDLAVVGAFPLLITSYMWLPFLRYGAWVNLSPYLQPEKYNGLGAPAVITYLVSGELFDSGRLPVFTLLLAVGAVSIGIARTRLGVGILALFLVWLVLYFGRPTLGRLYDLMPLANTLLIHRFSGAVHLFGIMLIGIGADALWQVARRWWRPWLPYAAAAVAVVALLPAIAERASFYDQGLQWMRVTQQDIAADADARTIIETIRALPRGRTFAGLRTDYGPQMSFDIPFNSARFSDLLVYDGLDVIAPPYNSSSLSSDMIWDFNYRRAEDYALFDVRYAVVPASIAAPPFLTPIKRTTRYVLYQAPPSAHAEWVSVRQRDATATQGDLVTKDRAWLLAPDRNARGSIRWDYPAHGVVDANLPPTCSRGDVRDDALRPASLDLTVSCDSSGTLMVKMTYDPGWRVTIDGAPTDTFMVSPAYLAVVVPAGTHHVDAQYTSVPEKGPLLALGIVALVAAVPVSRRLRLAA